MPVFAATGQRVAEAAQRLLRGELVAFATETVYGLGADAGNAAAVAAVYRLKGRPPDHPLIVHVADRAGAEYWARVGPRAAALIEAFWPGPLTLILRRRAGAPAHACGGQPSIGLRCPSHPVARALLAQFVALGGHGVAAPSANRFGRISPTTAQHVVDDLGAQAWVLDGGACEVGIESTIVDLSRGAPVVLRPGAISQAQILEALEAVRDAAPAEATAQPTAAIAAPRASGTLAAHYAPHSPVELVASEAFEFRLRSVLDLGVPFAVLAFRSRPDALRARPDVAWIEAPADAPAYARGLYAWLRQLDAMRTERILIERPPRAPAWAALDDRLTRAARGAGRR